MFLTISSICDDQPDTFSSHNTSDYYEARNRCVSVAIKRRESFPTTYCTLAADARSVSFGYGLRAVTPSDEFLWCTATAHGLVTVQRDAMATLPLFFAVSNGQLLLTNDYHELVHALPKVTLSTQVLREMLDGKRAESPVKEIQILHAQQTLYFSEGHVTVVDDGLFLEHSQQAEPTDARQFVTRYSDYLDYFIESRLKDETVAFEVSGGLDSALLPQYMAKRDQTQPMFSTALLADPLYRESQHRKITALSQKLDARVLTCQLDSNTNFPLARMITTNDYYVPFGDHTYHEVSLSLISQLRTAGVSVVCTGHGGDEFFGHSRSKGFLFQGMPRSTQIVKLYNNLYIENGIWPVSPFMDPRMFLWVQGLPIYARAGRKIMKAFHAAHGFVEEIYNPELREDFSTFIPACVLAGRYDELVQQWTESSQLHTLGIADAAEIRARYHRIKAGQYNNSKELIRACGDLYSWIMAETTVRALSEAADLA